MTVRRLQAELGGTTELAEWLAFMEQEPPNEELWQMFAMSCLNARKIAGDRRARLEHFLPHRREPELSAEQLAERLEAMLPMKRD